MDVACEHGNCMINLTDRPMVIYSEPINDVIYTQTQAVLKHLSLTATKPVPDHVTWKHPQFAYQFFFNSRNRLATPLDDCFLQACFDYTSDTTNTAQQRLALATIQRYFAGPVPPAGGAQSMRQGLRLLLIAMWEARVLLLPTAMAVHSHLKEMPSENEVLGFLAFHDRDPAVARTVVPASYVGLLRSALRHVIWATTWRRIEDVSIYEYSDIHRSTALYVAGKHEYRMSALAMPFSAFLALLLKAEPTRTTYDEVQLQTYSEWSAGKHFLQLPFKEYEVQRDELRNERVRGARLARKARGSGYRSTKGATDPGTIDSLLHKSKEDFTKEALIKLSDRANHDAALEYFAEFRAVRRDGIGWLTQGSIYPGREFCDTTLLRQVWRETFVEYLHYRKHYKGYEQEGSTIRALNLLADYLFLYLPWWRQIFSGSDVGIPKRPRDFTRYAFVQRTSEVEVEKLPNTLLEMITLRNPGADSKYETIKQLELYFAFIEQHYAEDENVAGRQFRNPIRAKFDLPRLRKRHKTAKNVFPLDAYGYLIHFGYAVEAFGEFLLTKAIAGEFGTQRRIFRDAQYFDAQEFGYVPIVYYRGRVRPIRYVPNTFTWAERWVIDKSGNRVQRYIPHLSTLRMLQTAVETGLRLQSIQWLDRISWDSPNVAIPLEEKFQFGPGDGPYISKLFVNTDKIKSGPWECPIVYRVRGLLARETQFQSNVLSPRNDTKVNYEYRDNSRFDAVTPLFRGIEADGPVLDGTYSDLWIVHLIGFQEFYNGTHGDEATMFVYVGPRKSKSGAVTVHVDNRGVLSCPLTIRAINTPHACRATFATNRQGLLETSDIAEVIGHQSEMETVYYQNPHQKDLADKLERADKAFWEEAGLFDADKGPYIKAARGDGRLALDFRRDREATISGYRFTSAVHLSTSADDDATLDGMELLHCNPLSLIKFHPTHLCPVGDNCPPEIVKIIGEPRRCGLCPLAMKCVDHLTGIAAKKNELVEKIRNGKRRIERLEKAGEPAAIIDHEWSRVELETNEFMGWHVSEQVLLSELDDLKQVDEKAQGDTAFLTRRPDIVSRHLQRLTSQSREVEFVLHRIAQSNAYKSVETPEIQAAATLIKRRLLAGSEDDAGALHFGDVDDIAVVAKMLKVMLEVKGKSLTEIADMIVSRDSIMLIDDKSHER